VLGTSAHDGWLEGSKVSGRRHRWGVGGRVSI
jgi:hypothetical protein